MIKSNYPERTGKHFICYCNKQTSNGNDYNVAQAVFRHTANVLELSQEQLSAEAHLSEASVSRFFRKCGFGTFSDFKKQFQLFLSHRNLRRTQEHLTAYHGRSEEEICRQLYESALGNLNATLDSLDLPRLEQILQLLRRSRTVYFVGDTRDMYCFYSLQLDLLCNGYAAYFYNIDEISVGHVPALDEHTVVVILSVNPFWYNEEMAYLCECAHKKQASVVLFTQNVPAEGVGADLCYLFGRPGDPNEGYYSLPLLGQALSALFYRR